MIQSILKMFPPERAHAIAKWAMKYQLAAPGPADCCIRSVIGSTVLDNPIGIAAGFDKNGELVDSFRHYGFGFLEVGSVTLHGGHGNPKPRLFRLPHGALLNRMGLNGDPAPVVADRLRRATETHYGVNIAKTHDPRIVGDKAVDDIIGSYRILKHYGIYTALNISCPNTAEGKTFERPEALRELFYALKAYRGPFAGQERPLLVKLSPGLADNLDLLEQIIGVCLDFNVGGFIASNTLTITHDKFGRGGLSGPDLREYALRIVKELSTICPGKIIIGCGGIETGFHAWRFLSQGATAFQAYAGFVRGPHAGRYFAHRICRELNGTGAKP